MGARPSRDGNRRANRPARPGRARFGLGAAIAVLGGGLFGWGTGAAVGIVRELRMNEFFQFDPATRTAGFAAVAVIGLSIAVAGWLLFNRGADAMTGSRFPLRGAHLSCLAASAGAAVSIPTWAPPTHVGTDGRARPAWDGGTWVLYYADLWLPVLFAFVAIVAIVIALRPDGDRARPEPPPAPEPSNRD